MPKRTYVRMRAYYMHTYSCMRNEYVCIVINLYAMHNYAYRRITMHICSTDTGISFGDFGNWGLCKLLQNLYDVPIRKQQSRKTR